MLPVCKDLNGIHLCQHSVLMPGLWPVVQGYRCLPDVHLAVLEDLCASRLARPVLGAAANAPACMEDADRTCHIQVSYAA